MSLSLQTVFLNPFALIAATIVLGGYFGKLNFRGLKLGSSGSLFVGLALGYFIYSVLVQPYATASEVPSQVSKVLVQGLVSSSLFTMSLIGFIAPVGLLASADIADVIKKYGLRFVILGFLITLSGALSSLFFIKWLGNAQSTGIIGTYVGALTSSPGLAAALEAVGGTSASSESLVGLGYAIGYIPGVLTVVLGMRLVPKWLGISMEQELKKVSTDVLAGKSSDQPAQDSKESFNVVVFMTVCLLGVIVGQVKLYFGRHLGWIGLGSTGGVLISALLIGHLMTSRYQSMKMSHSALSAVRDISLNMFLAIVGLRYGYTTVISIASEGLVYLSAALISALAAMATGIIIGRYFMKMNWIVLAGVICGGMTSTPGLAAALESCQSDEVAAGYGATYPVALISMIMFTRLMTYLV
ncbi:hypothetical protein [Fusibacter sp. JL216-2]|uniref:aspartate-alanine antiporter-like transporter n=1 Tax=Fusibacter sp. JL216-2 TaxID=3071453 RepID=UPI003D34A5D3